MENETATAEATEPSTEAVEQQAETNEPVQQTATTVDDSTVVQSGREKPEAKKGLTTEEAEDRWLKENPPEGTAKPVVEQDEDDEEPEKPAAPAVAPWKPEEIELLKRFKMNPDSKAYAEMDAAERAEMLEGLTGHVRYTSQLAQHVAQNKPAPQKEASQEQTADAVWTEFGKVYGDEMATDYQKVVRAEVQGAMGGFASQGAMLTDLAERLLSDDADAALAEWEPPEGVDKTNDGVRSKILDAAREQLMKSPTGLKGLFSGRAMRAAVKSAAQSMYQGKIDAAAAERKAKLGKTRAAGSPSRNAPRPPTTRAPMTMADRERLSLEGLDKNLSGEKLEAYIANGGR